MEGATFTPHQKTGPNNGQGKDAKYDFQASGHCAIDVWKPKIQAGMNDGGAQHDDYERDIGDAAGDA